MMDYKGCSLLLAGIDRVMSLFPSSSFYYMEELDGDSFQHSRPFVFSVVALVVLLFYCAYYRLFVVRRPRVVCADAARLAFLKKHCPVFFEEFWPTVWAPQAHMQTIIRVAIQTFPKSERRRESLRLSDGGHLCLDWYNEVVDDQPTVLMLPGVTGSSDENYVRHWIRDMTELGYRSVVVNYRGCGDSKLSTPKMYCGADISDLIEVVDHIHTTLPSSPLAAVGVSMGSMWLIKYISECHLQSKPCHIKAIMLVSAIWNVEACDEIIHRPFNKYTLNRHLCNNYKAIMRQNKAIFDRARERNELCVDYDEVLKCSSMRDLNLLLTLPMFGYKDIDHLIHESSPHLRLEHINIPVLALNAADDPFCPEKAIPVDAAEKNANLILVTTRKGGHIGFMEGPLPIFKNLMDRVLIQFAQAVFEHDAM